MPAPVAADSRFERATTMFSFDAIAESEQTSPAVDLRKAKIFSVFYNATTWMRVPSRIL